MSLVTPVPVVQDDAILHRYRYVHDAVPTSDGTGGTLAGIAPTGALLIDTDTPALWMNTGTKAEPVWTLVGPNGGGG